MTEPQATFEGWCVLEQMGHKKLAGYVTEQTVAGFGYLRIDVPRDGEPMTQLINPSTIYAITPTTEQIARHVAQQSYDIGPVSRWELRQLEAPEPPVEDDDDDQDEEDDDLPDYLDEDERFELRQGRG